MEKQQEGPSSSPESKDILIRDGPALSVLLKEMKDVLDGVRSKVQALTEKVKENSLLTADGISYLEAKHLLLLGYCQSILCYMLLKAEGQSVNDHPVVRRLVELRLFLEKIRPIDKKLQYQVDKLLRACESGIVEARPAGKETENEEDLLRYRPNPDLVDNKLGEEARKGEGVYRPPRIAPTIMDETKTSKEKRMELRKEREAVRQASRGGFMKELIGDMEGRPEEVRSGDWHESREYVRQKEKFEERARLEEEAGTRVPYTREEKKKIKELKRQRNGLLGLVDDFYHEVSSILPTEEKEQRPEYPSFKKGKKHFKSHKKR